MELIIKTLQEAVQVNLVYVVLMEIIVACLFVFNTILGAILGSITQGFSFKKLFYGLLKNIGLLVIIFGVCYILNLFTLTLNMIDVITIDIGFITTMEIVVVLVAWGVDIANDILSKIKSYKELKYISYDDIQVNINDYLGEQGNEE